MQLKGLVLTTKKIEKQTEIFKRISFYFVTYAKVVHKQFDIQYLWVITKEIGGSIKKEKILPVRFVPMVTK